MDPDLFRVALRAIFAPVVAEIPDQFLFLGVDGDHRLLFSQSGGYLAVDIAELRIPVGVAVALRGFAVALQTVTCLIEQLADQGAAAFLTPPFQRPRPTAPAPPRPPGSRTHTPHAPSRPLRPHHTPRRKPPPPRPDDGPVHREKGPPPKTAL